LKRLAAPLIVFIFGNVETSRIRNWPDERLTGYDSRS